MRYLRVLALIGLFLIPAGFAQAQHVSVGIGVVRSTRVLRMWGQRRCANTGITHMLRTRARLTATTGLAGSGRRLHWRWARGIHGGYWGRRRLLGRRILGTSWILGAALMDAACFVGGFRAGAIPR